MDKKVEMRHKMAKVITRVTNMAVSHAFYTWSATIRTGVRMCVLGGKLRAQLRQRLLLAVFGAWAEQVTTTIVGRAHLADTAALRDIIDRQKAQLHALEAAASSLTSPHQEGTPPDS